MEDNKRDSQLKAERSFRVAGLVAKAAKRFMRSINPAVEFGKPYHPTDSVTSGDRVSAAYSSKGPGSSGSSENGESTYKAHRGHRPSYLFAPLAPDDVQA